MTRHYAESRPDVIRRLRDSKMTISYHVRPPHILYPGFNGRLRDYETYRLDMTTGELLRDQPGGCQYVAETFGRKPVALGVPTGSPRERTAARCNYQELGAKVIVEHHESGTKLDRVRSKNCDELQMPVVAGLLLSRIARISADLIRIASPQRRHRTHNRRVHGRMPAATGGSG